MINLDYKLNQQGGAVPDPVTDLNASSNEDGTSHLQWQAGSDSGNPITDYKIEFSNDNKVSWNIFTHSANTNTNIIVDSLINGKKYYLRVSAINSDGEGQSVICDSYVIPGKNLNNIVNKINLCKTNFFNKEFTIDGNYVTLDVKKVNVPYWGFALQVPVFHYYTQLLGASGSQCAFKIDNSFYNKIPAPIKQLIGDNINNISIFFSPQTDQETIKTNIQRIIYMYSNLFPDVTQRNQELNNIGYGSTVDSTMGSQHLLFRPHYVFIPDPRNINNKGIENRADDITIATKVGLYDSSKHTTCTTGPNIISNFNRPRGLSVHGKKISTHDPSIDFHNNTAISVWSVINDVSGNNTKFYITLHWILPQNKYEDVRDKAKTHNTFNKLLISLQNDPYYNNSSNSSLYSSLKQLFGLI